MFFVEADSVGGDNAELIVLVVWVVVGKLRSAGFVVTLVGDSSTGQEVEGRREALTKLGLLEVDSPVGQTPFIVVPFGTRLFPLVRIELTANRLLEFSNARTWANLSRYSSRFSGGDFDGVDGVGNELVGLRRGLGAGDLNSDS